MTHSLIAAHGMVFSALSPNNDDARDWLERELSRSRYGTSGPNIFERMQQRISDWFDTVLGGLTGDSSPVPGIIAIVVVLALVGLVIYLLRFVRRTPRSRTRGDGDTVLGSHVRTADEYRTSARERLAAGDPDGAIRDAMRAIARRGLETQLLPNAQSMTAHEVARRLSGFHPDLWAALTDTAAAFDAAAYGGRHIALAQAQVAIDLDVTLAARRTRADADTETETETAGAST